MRTLIDIALLSLVIWFVALKAEPLTQTVLPAQPDTIEGDPAFVVTETLSSAAGPESDVDKRLARVEFDIDKLNENFKEQADQIDRLLTLAEQAKPAKPAKQEPPPPKNWTTDLDAAEKLSKRTNKPILIDFETSGCEPCLAVKHEVYEASDIFPLISDDYILVWHYVTDTSDPVAKRFGVTKFPTATVEKPSGAFSSFNPFIPIQGNSSKPDRSAFMRELSKHSK